jgi:hypothetical protein
MVMAGHRRDFQKVLYSLFGKITGMEMPEATETRHRMGLAALAAILPFNEHDIPSLEFSEARLSGS